MNNLNSNNYDIHEKNTPLLTATSKTDNSASNQLMIELLATENENQILRHILASSSDPILITTPHAKIVYVNPAWEKLTGYLFAEVQGKNPSLLKSGKTPKTVYQKMWQQLKEQKPFSSNKVINKRKDGSEFNVFSSIFPVIRDGNVIHYVQILRDITKEIHIEELRREFMSLVAHELRTPLTVLKLRTQILQAKAKTSVKSSIKHEDFALIDVELDRLTRLINDIVDGSRVETGKLHMNFEIIDLAELIKAVVKQMKAVDTDHIIIMNKIPSITVTGDYQRLEQVLINLISNAQKYSSKSSTIRVYAKRLKRKVEISIHDEGIGIQKKNLTRIFDKFYQLSKKSRSGFGLGLYISKEIIKSHKGKIWVESEIGKGSTFFFTLPLTNN